MLYTTKPGDTFLSIASRLTLSPAYATAIMEANGITQAEREITDDLANTGEIDIPDAWLRSSYTPAQLAALGVGGAARSSILPWVVIAGLVALAA